MRLRVLTMVASAMFLSAFACEKTPPAADPDVAEQQIRDLVKQMNASLVARDDSTIATMFTPDGRLLPPYEKEVAGPEEIRRYFAELWPLNATLAFTPRTVHVAQSGDMAIEEGTWAITVPGTSDTVSDDGKYLVTWVRKDTDWKIYQDIWNSSNAPVPTPEDSAGTPD